MEGLLVNNLSFLKQLPDTKGMYHSKRALTKAVSLGQASRNAIRLAA